MPEQMNCNNAQIPTLHIRSVVIAIMLIIVSAALRAGGAPVQEPSKDLTMARKAIARRPRGMIYNDDNVDAQTRTPKEFIASRLQYLPRTQVDMLTFDPFSVDNIAIWPSEISEVDVESYPLFVAGHDPIALALEFCHKHNIEFYPSFRMNDIHESLHENWRRTANWKREHPEYLLGKHGDNHRYPLSSPRAWWAAKDYAVPEVRERQFLVVQEMCEDYAVDGIELDWFRSPLFFGPTLDLEPVEDKHLRILNDFMRRIRTMTERVAKKRGHPMLIACRVPMNVERSFAIGLDVKTWLEEDLVDILILGGGYAPMAMSQSVREMVEFTRKYDVPTYACISASGMTEKSGRNNVESWRGSAMNIHQTGAGVYLFNVPYGLQPPDVDSKYQVYHSSPQQVQLYNELGSAETLKGLDKIYAVDNIVEDTYEGDLRPGLVVPGRLPIELKPNKWSKIMLPVGEDIVANTPQGKQAHMRLHVGVPQLSLDDQVHVRLNGQAVYSPPSRRGAETANLLKNASFESDGEIGDDVSTWRSDGFDGHKRVPTRFSVGAKGRKNSRSAILEVTKEHIWALADQIVPVQVDPTRAVEFSVWMRAEKDRTRTHLVLYLLLPDQKVFDAAQVVGEFEVSSEWKQYRVVLDFGTAKSLPTSLKNAQIRVIIQVYQRGPAKLYVDDGRLAFGTPSQVDFNVAPAVVRSGNNEVELKLDSRQPSGNVSIEGLELILSYQRKTE